RPRYRPSAGTIRALGPMPRTVTAPSSDSSRSRRGAREPHRKSCRWCAVDLEPGRSEIDGVGHDTVILRFGKAGGAAAFIIPVDVLLREDCQPAVGDARINGSPVRRHRRFTTTIAG